MLTFAPHNTLLSSHSADNTDRLDQKSATLAELAAFWASDAPDNGVPPELRSQFYYVSGGGWIEPLWPMAVTMRGLNPFRQRVL